MHPSSMTHDYLILLINSPVGGWKNRIQELPRFIRLHAKMRHIIMRADGSFLCINIEACSDV